MVNITDIPIPVESEMIRALGYVKKASKKANRDLGVPTVPGLRSLLLVILPVDGPAFET